MYHVIVVLDQSRNKSYYYSYANKDGNIVCEELPPFQDINKARACYWNAEDAEWFFDADKYAELLAAQAAAEQAEKEAEAVPTNEELAMAMMEIADNVSILMDAVAELGSTAKGGE